MMTEVLDVGYYAERWYGQYLADMDEAEGRPVFDIDSRDQAMHELAVDLEMLEHALDSSPEKVHLTWLVNGQQAIYMLFLATNQRYNEDDRYWYESITTAIGDPITRKSNGYFVDAAGENISESVTEDALHEAGVLGYNYKESLNQLFRGIIGQIIEKSGVYKIGDIDEVSVNVEPIIDGFVQAIVDVLGKDAWATGDVNSVACLDPEKLQDVLNKAFGYARAKAVLAYHVQKGVEFEGDVIQRASQVISEDMEPVKAALRTLSGILKYESRDES